MFDFQTTHEYERECLCVYVWVDESKKLQNTSSPLNVQRHHKSTIMVAQLPAKLSSMVLCALGKTGNFDK
jgi:hypothetical protein